MKKILECNYDGCRITVEFHEGKTNPYRIYRKWWDMGWHRKQIEKYGDFNSCLCFVADYYKQNTNTRK